MTYICSMKHTQSHIAMSVMDNSTVMVANRVSHILSKVTGKVCHAHDIEEDSFELSLDGVKYDGGSYYIDSQNNLILASVTPQKLLGKVHDTNTIERNLSL